MIRDSRSFDIIVVGGGHAGCEAALAAARMGCRVCLATLREETIGALSCNPAVGGVGKGQIAREIDALGGVMGEITDSAAIQYRMLNTSKGEAVRALRAQVDKQHYSQAMRQRIAATEGLTVVEGSVEDLVLEAGRVVGVTLGDGSVIPGRRVILTNGTFLRGLMHTGEEKKVGGRVGEGAVTGLSAALERLGFESGRLKTGTPPRLAAESIDFSKMDLQEGDAEPSGFSHFKPSPRRAWVPCHVTRTNSAVHDCIRGNIERSPMFSGEIEGIGPRYCPSIEDKVVRFPERDGHVVHLEPEGLNTNSIYVNGISTSLPSDVQDTMVRAIPGLEQVEFLRYGYAVEYDFFPPYQIKVTFESRNIPGLYLAGQICGTSGYEEAAAQGFLAGVNAARSLKEQDPFILRRDEAYMGVLADDLVRCDPREPYRMFTSRAEFRLLLRHDNADLRLFGHGCALGLVAPADVERVEQKRQRIDETLEKLKEKQHGPDPWIHWLRHPGARFADLVQQFPEISEWNLSAEVEEQVQIEAKYEAYIARQRTQVARLERLERWRVPDAFAYSEVSGLRGEAREKLDHFRPENLGAARRIAGVTPADVSLIMVTLKARFGSYDEVSPSVARPQPNSSDESRDRS